MQIKAQAIPVKIVEKEIPNRLELYAINENDQDLDVKITITGTNFRQSRAKPRFIRVPAASKVHLKTIMLMRDKQPSYTYDLVVNDSLSNRALIKEYEQIKVKPRKQITIYIPKNCVACDSLVNPLAESKYLYKSVILGEKPELQAQLQNAFGEGNPIDSLKTPIVNLGGKLHTQIISYEQLMDAMKKD